MNNGNDQRSSSSNTIVGRIRRYSEQTKSYRKWEDIVYTPTTTNRDYGTTKHDDQRIVIGLHRGGKLTFYPNMLPIGKQRVELQTAMRTCKLYRQYTRSQVYYEPRFHVLLSQSAEADVSSSPTDAESLSLTAARGYSYHGVAMKAQPISQVPAISTYAAELATLYNLPNQTWDIGVDCIIYRDGHDSIGWHADDSQGESIILCVVIAHSPSCGSNNSKSRTGDFDSRSNNGSNNIPPRSVHIRPKNNIHGKKKKSKRHLYEGDEEIQLYIHEGDGYEMDGYMQHNYEHCVPKKCIDTSHRFVLIFRHGNVASVPIDSGVALTELASVRSDGGLVEERIGDEEEDNLSLKENNGIADCEGRNNDNHDEDVTSLFSRLRVKRPLVSFGHPPIHNLITEGSLYSRRHLYSTYAHRADQRGVNGNMVHGCDSIVVSRQSLNHREEDGLCWLRYTSNRGQGGGALLISHVRQLPIRVFRSSKINNTLYSPPEFHGGKTSYRYDGLYVVTRVWDQTGQLVTLSSRGVLGGEKEEDSVKKFPGDGIQYTFHLERLLCKSSLPLALIDDVEYINELSINELWTKIQISHYGRTAADWSTKQESRVENEPRKLHIKEINLNGISKLAMTKPRSYKFHEGNRKGDQTKRKAKGGAVQSMYNLTVDAIDEIEKLILVEHWQNSFHLTCGAIIALESFALESMQAIFDCTLQQPFVPPLPKCLDILPELVNDVPRKEDVDDSTINTPLQQLQHNIQSLISLRWRVCNSSLGPGASGYASGAVSVLGGGGAMSVAPMGFDGGPGANGFNNSAVSLFGGGAPSPVMGFGGGPGAIGFNNSAVSIFSGGGAPSPLQFMGMNTLQRAYIAQQNAMMKSSMNSIMSTPSGSFVHNGAGSVYGGAGSVYDNSGSFYGSVNNGMQMQPIQPAQYQQQMAMMQQQQMYDDTFLTSSTLPSWSYNNMPLQQSLVSSRWKDGRSYHDQLSSTCRPLNNHPKLLLRRKQSKQVSYKLCVCVIIYE